MIRLYLLILGSFFWVTGVFGQQNSNYSLYMLNEFNWNPAYAGLEESLSITAGLREQWSGLTETTSQDAIGPSTQFVNAHLPVYLLKGGFGVQLENDALGPQRQLRFNGAYNYQTFLGPGVLSIGVGAGIYQFELDGSILRTPDGIYNQGLIDHQDGILPLSAVSSSISTFRVGAYYKADWFEVGVSAIHLNEPTLEIEQLDILLKRTFFLGASFHINISDGVQLHPSMLAKSDATQTQLDLSSYVQFNENLFLGGGIRGLNSNSLDAATLLGGFNLSKKIKVAYAYDITLSGLQNVSNGSHELVLNYNLGLPIGKGRPPKVIFNPRNL